MKLAITSFLLPPGIALVLTAVACYLLFRKRIAKGKWLLLVALLMGWSFSTEALGRFLSVALIAQVDGPTIASKKDVDLILVLTGGMTYAGDIGWLPTQESYRRLAVGYQLQERIDSRVPVLISGGKTAGVRHPSEAEIVYRHFDQHRAQITPTLFEDSSLNTYESALQCASIVRERSADAVVLVTSEVHMLRSLATFRSRGIDAIPFPVLTLPRGPFGVSDFLPSWRGVMLNAKAMYEIYGLLEYVLAGKVHINDVFYTA